MKNKISFLLLIVGACIMISWGGYGHYKINSYASLSFNPELSQFMAWSSILADHASDADDRKDSDDSESPKHYIDIDNYPEFIAKQRLPETYSEIVAKYGVSFVIKNGTLPWATRTSYDTLIKFFKNKNWDKAVLTASDLGHYIADGHNPLHITANYDGQKTNQKGIHSRYESTMINAYISQIDYSGHSLYKINNINTFIFDYIYKNNKYVDSVLIADTYAYFIANSYLTTTYRNELWKQTSKYTINLFDNASYSIALLIYNAWLEAGSPSIASDITQYNSQNTILLSQNEPNPFRTSTKIKISTNTLIKNVRIKIYDTNGRLVDNIFEGQLDKDDYEFEWLAKNKLAGIYYCILYTDKYFISKKMILIE